MTVLFQSGLSPSSTDYPLTHARIAHSNNWLSGGSVTGGDGSKLLQENGDALLQENGDNLLLDLANSTADGYFATAPTGSLTYEFWQPATLPSTWQYTHTSSAECDYCAIAAHTMGTNGNTLEVQYYSGSAWVDLIPATAITTDEPVFIIFAATTAQKWRIRVSGGTAPNIGVVRFGSAMQLPRPFYGNHTPIPFGRQTVLRGNKSETGEYLGRTKQRVMLATELTWNHIPSDWMRANWASFQKAAEAEPFFIAWRPATFGDVAYAQVDQVPQPSNMGIRDLMSVSMTIRARGYD